ncbi:hypothetical protein BKA57DRAFT_445068 [Linnemannia elongata]|nr:hypothetical protein BKA57DRAFT_445068 [Linnemannia elongata]
MLFSVLACLFICFVLVVPVCLSVSILSKQRSQSGVQPGNQATSCQLQFRFVQLVGQRTIRFYSSLLPSSVTLPFFCLHLILYFTHYPP